MNRFPIKCVILVLLYLPLISGCVEADNEAQVINSDGALSAGEGAGQNSERTLYINLDDATTGSSQCYESCPRNWSALLDTDGAPSGVNDLGTFALSNGTMQVTYQGNPLYLYSRDKKSTDTRGVGQGGNFVVATFESTPVDSDGDGVEDGLDQCPGTPAGVTVDANGCEVVADSDGDGVIDSLDQCPGTPSGATVDANGCEIVADSDGDGVIDSLDQCPGTSEGATVDANGCAVILDSDGDGVIDSLDQCPGTPEGIAVDASGCELISSLLIEAEDYVAYYDTDAGSNGAAGNGDDVDIENTTDVGGGRNVGWTVPGEWLEYEVNLNAGLYAVETRVASQVSTGAYELLLDGVVFASGTVASTGDWQIWETHSVGTLEVESAGSYSLRLNVTGSDFNLNWIRLSLATDSDGDGVVDANDLCPDTPAGKSVDTDGCEIVTVDAEVSFANERLVGGKDSAFPGFTLYVFDNDQSLPGTSQCNDGCATNWPPVLVTDGTASGVINLSTITRADGSAQAAYNGRPLYFYAGDSAAGDINGEGAGGVWWVVPFGVLGQVTPLFDDSTLLEPDSQYETETALVTRWSDRPRTRHAREDEFQRYDHYIEFYFENRSSSIEIIDEVAKGGDTVTMNVRTIFPIDPIQAENRWWYTGFTTVAAYASNVMMDYLGTDGTYYYYRKTSNYNTRLGREIQLGDRMEFEISQFSDPSIPRGQTNYYGTTFLYIVGEEIVPWYAEAEGTSQFREDSRKIPEEYWLGGKTSMHYQYTNEPNDHFMQMATNLGYDNGQKFLEGRRVHHSSTVDGMHDEHAANGVFADNVGLTGTRYINDRCTGCHERNGSAPVAENGESLDRWVFKIGDADGEPTPDKGRVLQIRGSAAEGDVSIASWTETAEGLRKPNYQFTGGTPDTFSARIAPRLVGLGLLEAIPETAILALEDPNDANGDGISGRAHRVIDPETGVTRIGRFGWKATTSSVRYQTAGALNTDMGVRTSVLPNPDCGFAQTNCGENSPMMSEENLDKLVTYLSTLGVRPQRVWKAGVEDSVVLAGRDHFRAIGCADCHTEIFQTSEFHPLAEVRDQTIRPYSDLLLHDMGPEMADSLGDGQASGSEWRTTPLWGLGLSACVTGGVDNPTQKEGGEVCTPHHAYLHDGRARTIEEAILWHGGEGQASNDAYQALSAEDKQEVLRFLESL